VGIELIPACDLTSAEPIPSTIPGTDLHRVDRGRTLLSTFDGGCAGILFPTVELATPDAGRALFDEIHLMTRDELRGVGGWEL